MNYKKIFAKYMKAADPKKAHAELSASGSDRWLSCPASVQLSRGRSVPDNEYSTAGTHAHTLLQFVLENGSHLLDHSSSKAFKEYIGYTPEQHQAVYLAQNFVNTKLIEMRSQTGVEPEILVEQKVELPGVGFGTADVILYQPFGLLHIIDYKHGKYKVEAKENTQGLYYAVAAAEKFGWDFSEAWITIIQPNAYCKEGRIRTWKTTSKRLEYAQKMFIDGAAMTKKKNPDIVPNHKYCYFCAARPVCPAHMEQKRDKIMERFQR